MPLWSQRPGQLLRQATGRSRRETAAHYESAARCDKLGAGPRWRPRMLTFKGRKEDMRLVRGRGQYSSDWNLPRQLHACFLRADRAHAAIRSIDAAGAKRMAGVVAVLDGKDIVDAGMRTLPPTVPYAGRGGARILTPERPALAHERVR